MIDTKIQWTKIKHDINGNPRYVCHFMSLNTKEELDSMPNDWNRIRNLYNIALARAKKIGGKKYHNKSYGGGILFQSYSIDSTERDIADILAKG